MPVDIISEFTKWLPATISLLPIFVAYIYFQIKRDKQRSETQYNLMREELKYREHLSYKAGNVHERDERYGAKYFEEIMYRFESLEKRLMSNYDSKSSPELNNKINLILKELELGQQKNQQSNIRIVNNNDSSEQLIKELSHALNTPLSQIEVAASVASAQDEKFGDSANSIINSVQICKSFLGAYRELILSTSTSATVWNPPSLLGAVESAHFVYIKKMNKELSLNANLPDSIKGYSNNYLSALLFPLIENAIEASPDNSELKVELNIFENNSVLTVTNKVNDLSVTDKIYKSGYTTKKNHEGLGLTSVKRLLSAIEGADIKHRLEHNIISFDVTLPRRAK